MAGRGEQQRHHRRRKRPAKQDHPGKQEQAGKKALPKEPAPDDVIHDTGDKFQPEIPGNIDPDTHKPKRHAKKTRIKRRRNGKKEVTFPPAPTIYPLDPVPSGDAKIAGDPEVHVSAHVHTLSKPKPNEPPPEPPPSDSTFGDFYGNMVLFCVDGCPDATFYQFYNQSFEYSNKGETDWKSGWRYDTGNGKAGKYNPLPDSSAPGVGAEPAMFDAPGQWGNTPPHNVAPHAGDTVTRTDQFETFVCCGKKLIGYWTWQQTLTYTWEKTSEWSAPSVTPAAPSWNADPTTGGEPYDMLRNDRICSAK
jgi:hypothetical protein